VSRKHSLTEIHLAVVLFGLAGLFGKWIPLSPFVIVWGRVLFASLTLGLFLLSRERISRPVFPRNHGLFLFLGLLLAVHWSCFFQSIKVSSVAVGLLSYSSFPLFTAFLEPLISRGSLSLRRILYALLCLVGVFLIVPRFRFEDSTFQGVLWGLAAGLTFALLTIFNRRLSLRFSSLVIALYQDSWAALFLTPAVFVLRPNLDGRNIILLAVLGIFCTAVAHTLFIKGMRIISAHTAAVISSMEPVYGILLAYVFLNEIPSARTLIGGGIILWAVIALTVRDPA
jgi:drug/metabolite transporter (DMT)-like permease